MTSDTDKAHLERLAAIVNERIASLGEKARLKASPAQLLAVVALGLAEDLEVAERRRQEVVARTRDVVGQAISRIDQRLAADAAAGTTTDEA